MTTTLSVKLVWSPTIQTNQGRTWICHSVIWCLLPACCQLPQWLAASHLHWSLVKLKIKTESSFHLIKAKETCLVVTNVPSLYAENQFANTSDIFDFLVRKNCKNLALVAMPGKIDQLRYYQQLKMQAFTLILQLI